MATASSNVTICKATVRSTGQPCKSKAVAGSEFCGKHLPDKQSKKDKQQTCVSPEDPKEPTKTRAKKSGTKSGGSRKKSTPESGSSNGERRECEAGNVPMLRGDDFLTAATADGCSGPTDHLFSPEAISMVPGEVCTDLFQMLHDRIVNSQK
jgi:hypothetical protein